MNVSGKENEKDTEENLGTAPGTLYLCATPIGNLGDITLRVLDTLKEVDLIAAEDTRDSRRLLNHYSIHTPLTSYHEHNRYDKARTLTEKLKAGMNIALITDAGTPGISDPGEELVRQCMEAGIKVTSLPGPCACVTAVSLSGIPARRFCFEAFLPEDKKERQNILDGLKDETRAIVLYEAPHNLLKTLADLSDALGEDRKITICRELTKIHEEVISSSLGEAYRACAETEPRGEYVLVVEGKSRESLLAQDRLDWEAISIEDHVRFYEEQGFEKKEAMRRAARDRGVSRRDVYQALTAADKEQESG